MVAITTMLAGALGFGLAGSILALAPSSTNMLFVADAVTFALAGVVVVGVRNLGGGRKAATVAGALKQSWSIVAARPHLVVGVIGAFLIPISFPALVALAYAQGGQTYGGELYSTLELVLGIGIIAGSVAVSRLTSIGSMRTVGAGLFLTGVFSLVIGLTGTIQIVIPALLLASFGNPIYAVGNQTALMEAADQTNRGALMATRFGLAQTASIIGVAVGGVLTQEFSPGAAYGVLGVGLVILALYALAAGRSTINPLHGAAYEEALQAKT